MDVGLPVRPWLRSTPTRRPPRASPLRAREVGWTESWRDCAPAGLGCPTTLVAHQGTGGGPPVVLLVLEVDRAGSLPAGDLPARDRGRRERPRRRTRDPGQQ